MASDPESPSLEALKVALEMEFCDTRFQGPAPSRESKVAKGILEDPPEEDPENQNLEAWKDSTPMYGRGGSSREVVPQDAPTTSQLTPAQLDSKIEMARKIPNGLLEGMLGVWGMAPLPGLEAEKSYVSKTARRMVLAAMNHLRNRTTSTARAILAEISPFYYQDLPSQTSIRVLRLDTSINDPEFVKLTLRVVDLKDNPTFNALSYVWADYRPQLRQTYISSLGERDFPVICNDQLLYVTSNLFQALKELRIRQRTQPMSDIWIDQICVNQKNNDERSTQIQMMGRLYKSAERVIGWLGVGDAYTRDAIPMVRKLAAIPDDQYLKRVHGIHPAVLEISISHWQHLSSLVSRPYFNRAWIVQEVVLTNNFILFCGSEDISWLEMVRLSKFLAATKPWIFLADHPDRSSASIFKEERFDSEKLGKSIEFSSELSALVEVKARTKDHRTPWQDLLMIGRNFGATDPRDKFYALLGLVRERLPTNAAELPRVDYNKSHEAVTLEFSKLYLDVTKSLQLLVLVEDPVHRVNKNLPSWVPDPTSRLLPEPLDYLDHHTQEDSKAGQMHSTGRSFSFDPSGNVLHVRGIKLNTIEGKSSSFNDIRDSHNWIGVFNLLKSISTSTTPRLSIDEMFIHTILTILSTPLSNNSPAPSLPMFEFGDWMIQSISLIRGSADFFSGYKTAVSDCVSSELAALEDVTSTTSMPRDEILRGAGGLASHESGLLLKAGIDYAKGYFGKQGREDLFQLTKQKIMDLWMMNPNGAFPSPERVESTLGVLERPPADGMKRSVMERIRKFQAALGLRLHSRRLFVTNDWRLSLGPQSIQQGDQIWMFAGERMPFVLRRVGETRYRVIGHTYVHGLLEREGVSSNSQMDEICLV
ncbi:uncharacterized protein PAC_01295 [Phialocephala subalpina]|uniref:Heterokaryon incompatibility domain-containing protein n=1 Tax=Phialocephala subalpina TaxID=576137 RepID=A0A1L7WFA9_9HELO|nr:uncharacterized protein PAC_01295 [Phialocephala subalpina]